MFSKVICSVYFKTKICNFVDDDTIYSRGDDANFVFEDLEHDNLRFLGKMD